MHIRKIDLNLLPIFDAVMSERSVTAAGRRLGMSTSAVSHALARLRDLTGDELFEPHGRGVRPTSKAIEMAGRISSGIAQLQKALDGRQQRFDPATATRTFVVDIASAGQTVLLPHLVSVLSAAGPGLRVRLASERAGAVVAELCSGATELAIDFEQPCDDGLTSEMLYEDDWLVVARRGHPAFAGGQLTRRLFETLGHVALSWTRTRGDSPLAQRLNAAGVKRDVRVHVATLCAVPRALEASDLIMTLSRRTAELTAEHRRLEMHALPFVLAPIQIFQIWHERLSDDPGHQWLRSALRQVRRPSASTSTRAA